MRGASAGRAQGLWVRWINVQNKRERVIMPMRTLFIIACDSLSDHRSQVFAIFTIIATQHETVFHAAVRSVVYASKAALLSSPPPLTRPVHSKNPTELCAYFVDWWFWGPACLFLILAGSKIFLEISRLKDRINMAQEIRTTASVWLVCAGEF